jgi:hypothetical protein
MKTRSYSELIKLPTIRERYEYLKLLGDVGFATFGSSRYLNQGFYSSSQWKRTRRDIIIRDKSCDLGIEEYEIFDRPVIHHINPITIKDIEDENWDKLFDPDNLITVSYNTHQAIHFGSESMLPRLPIERTQGDTCLWR